MRKKRLSFAVHKIDYQNTDSLSNFKSPVPTQNKAKNTQLEKIESILRNLDVTYEQILNEVNPALKK